MASPNARGGSRVICRRVGLCVESWQARTWTEAVARAKAAQAVAS